MILARLTRAVREQNWFAVALEFIIVVTGVLLAMLGSQWAGEREARRSAAILEDAMDADLMIMAIGTMRRYSTHPCLVEAMGRLNEAVSIENGAPFTPPPPAQTEKPEESVFNNYYPVGLWSYPTHAFDRAVATGAFDHMDARRAADYSAAYETVVFLAQANAQEEILRNRLSIVDMIERMDEPTRLDIRRNIAELDGWNLSVLTGGRHLFDVLDRLGIEPSPQDRADWTRYNEIARELRGDCVIDLPLDFSGRAVGNSWSYEINE